MPPGNGTDGRVGGAPLYSPLLEAAIRLAARGHHHQFRKSPDEPSRPTSDRRVLPDRVPYVAHLMATVCILARIGASDDVLAAAAGLLTRLFCISTLVMEKLLADSADEVLSALRERHGLADFVIRNRRGGGAAVRIALVVGADRVSERAIAIEDEGDDEDEDDDTASEGGPDPELARVRFEQIREQNEATKAAIEKYGSGSAEAKAEQDRLAELFSPIKLVPKHFERLVGQVRVSVEQVREQEKVILQIFVKRGKVPRKSFIKAFPGHESDMDWFDSFIGGSKKYADKLELLRPDGRDIRDPFGSELKTYQKVRDEIRAFVESLPEFLQ